MYIIKLTNENVPIRLCGYKERVTKDEAHVIPCRSIFEPRHEKTNVLVSDLVRHKPGCTATEDG